MALGGVDKRRPNLVSFGGEQTVDREEKKREEEEEEEKKMRREEEGEKFKQGQKGMELHGILCMNFHAWMVISCLQT